MHKITMAQPSRDFLAMWRAAGKHIQSFFEDGLLSWLKVDPRPPFLEHLSFRLGNQVFFIRFEDVEGQVEVPGNREGLLSVAGGWNGHPCLMPMRRTLRGWEPDRPGWGLIDLRNGRRIDPAMLVTDELVPISAWELLDFAVQVVRDDLKQQGCEILCSQSNPQVDPNIWFVADMAKGLEWVVVRAAHFPERRAKRPANLDAIARNVAHLSQRAHCACVSFASADDPEGPL
ncbi:hypothetical protein [Erythrobacter cryptus]|uniref:hypothetical protein n=1 Tax=Erythrobacter cryptus TaxID=196588 RepID=UPI0004149EF6|nr:hypothetical protein [Erythrobacter cryptus]